MLLGLPSLPLLALLLAAPSPGMAGEQTTLWDATRGPEAWAEVRGLSADAQDGLLRLDVAEPDSWLRLADLDIDPADVAWIHMRYLAEGFEGQRTSGQVFYQNANHGFADTSYIHLPALVADGQWHDLWVEVARSMRCDYYDFALGGQITALRLDLVDQAPGRIELERVELLRSRPPIQVPAAGRCLNGWAEPKGLAMSREGDVTRLEVRERDSWVTLDGLDLDPATARYLVIRYRATGFEGLETTGQVFYANANHDIDGDWKLGLPSVVADGRWHDMVVDAFLSLGVGHVDWLYGGTVRKLRLDLVDQAPGVIELGTVFLSPRLQTTSMGEIAGARGHLLPAASFGERAFSLSLPAGPQTVWARVVDTTEAAALVRGLSVEGAKPVVPELSGTGGWTWARLAQTEGGKISIRREAPASSFLDAVLIAPSDAQPSDAPVTIPWPTTSTMKPAEQQAETVPGAYWTGAMLACPAEGKLDPQTGGTVTYFRKTVDVPDDMQSAWLQVSVDDFFRLYLNGEKIAENVRSDSWKTPTVLEVTDKVKRGAGNCFAIEAINARGPGGVLFDLTINLPDHAYQKVVSDAGFLCSAEGPEGWAGPEFDDSNWLEPTVQLGPPNPPWTVRIPYEDKTWHPKTTCIASSFRDTVRGGEAQQVSFTFSSEKPLEAGEVLVLKLANVDTGKQMLTREVPLAADNLQPRDDGSVTVTGITVPLSRWLEPANLLLTVGLPGRELSESPELAMGFRLVNDPPTETLTSQVRMEGSAPVLYVNDRPIYPMVANGYERGKVGLQEAFRSTGHNIAAMWIDGAGLPQWWVGPDQYDFSGLDDQIISVLDYDPNKLILPIIWAAPPPWWAELYPEEIAKFSDGKPWEYYRATPSFSSEQWRKDAAAAMEAFVKYVESRPYASRVLGYWVIGGVSAEWQGWGCHGSEGEKHLMDYSRPAQEGFREFLSRKYPGAAGNVEIPTIEERLQSELGQFRDPVAGRRCIDFNEFYSEALADCMLSCVHAAKEAVGRRKIVGVYFGYTLEYTNMAWCLQMSGHNMVRKALDSPDVDFFSAPQSYSVRAPGEDMGWMWAWRSMQNAGKLVWPDDDTRTFLSGPSEHSPVVNPHETQQVLRRNFATQLCNLCPQGFLAIISGRELGSPSIAKDTWAIRRAGEYCVQNKVSRKAEIAVVLDEDSTKYLRYDAVDKPSGEIRKTTHWNGAVSYSPRHVMPLTGELISQQRARIARIGAPVDYILQSDLVRQETDYKLYIMLSSFQYDDVTLAAVRRLQQKGVTILWCYAPGFIRDGVADVGNMEALTGLRFRMDPDAACPYTTIADTTHPITEGLAAGGFGLPFAIGPQFSVDDPEARILGLYRDSGLASLAVKPVGQSRAAYCGSPKLPADLLRNLARFAGVHLYSEDLDTVAANDSFILLHTATAGSKTVHLKAKADVVDVFEGQVLARGVDQVTIDIPAEETRLLFVGDAESFLRTPRAE